MSKNQYPEKPRVLNILRKTDPRKTRLTSESFNETKSIQLSRLNPNP
jgi:hypothetical protein